MYKMQKTAAVYSIAVAIGMSVYWLMTLASGNMPELEPAPVQAAIHIVAEFMTVLSLIIGGYGLFSRRGWGPLIHIFSLGMVSA
ncbi:MAG: hypothetical protein MUO76_19705, partial [Anaerolineaceae bacterium]|nr:hypothetical protein [Anaerolineaceae bacterium]